MRLVLLLRLLLSACFQLLLAYMTEPDGNDILFYATIATEQSLQSAMGPPGREAARSNTASVPVKKKWLRTQARHISTLGQVAMCIAVWVKVLLKIKGRVQNDSLCFLQVLL